MSQRMKNSEPHMTEEQARRLWARAAELQAEADRVREEAGDGSDERFEGGPVPGRGEEDADVGYSLTHVRHAALEVGIQPEVLGLALGEESILRLEGGPDTRRVDRMAALLLKDERNAFEVRRPFAFPALAVWSALERVILDEPHDQEILEILGGRPEEGGVVVLESPTAYQDPASLRYRATFADVKRHLVQVVPEGDGRCSVLVRAPLRRSRRVNGIVGAVLSGGGSILAGLVGMGIAVGTAGTGGLAGPPLVLVFAGLMGGGAAGGGLMARKGYRALYRYGLRSLERTWERILSRVERELERDAREALPPSPETPGPGAG